MRTGVADLDFFILPRTLLVNSQSRVQDVYVALQREARCISSHISYPLLLTNYATREYLSQATMIMIDNYHLADLPRVHMSLFTDPTDGSYHSHKHPHSRLSCLTIRGADKIQAVNC